MEQWKLEAIDFEVKAIETFLELKFEGSTLEEKQEFIAEYKKKRVEVTSQLLIESYKDYVKEKKIDGEI